MKLYVPKSLYYCVKDSHESNTHREWATTLDCEMFASYSPCCFLPWTSDAPPWDASHFHPISGPVWVSDFTSVFSVLWASSRLMLWEGNFHRSQLVSEL